MDIALLLPSFKSYSHFKIAGDLTSFIAAFSMADTQTPILSATKTMLLTTMPDPSQTVVDDITKAAAALVISFVSRVVFDLWEKFKEKNIKARIEHEKKEKAKAELDAPKQEQ